MLESIFFVLGAAIGVAVMLIVTAVLWLFAMEWVLRAARMQQVMIKWLCETDDWRTCRFSRWTQGWQRWLDGGKR